MVADFQPKTRLNMKSIWIQGTVHWGFLKQQVWNESILPKLGHPWAATMQWHQLSPYWYILIRSNQSISTSAAPSNSIACSFCPWVLKFNTPSSQLLRCHPWNIWNAAGQKWHLSDWFWHVLASHQWPKPPKTTAISQVKIRLAKSAPINSQNLTNRLTDFRGTNRPTPRSTDSSRMTDRCTGLICANKKHQQVSHAFMRGVQIQDLWPA